MNALNRFIVFVVLFFMVNLNLAQQVYFNKMYPNDRYVSYSGLIGDSSNIYGMGYILNNLSNFERVFVKHNYLGDTLLSKTLLKNDTISYLDGFSNIICKIGTNLYSVGGEEYINQTFNNETKVSSFLLKFNEDGDTIFKKSYWRFNSYRSIFSSVIVNYNKSIIILGQNIKVDSLNQRQVKVYIANLDTLGNIIWEHEYGFNNQIAVTPQIIPASDGGYYIPGSIDDATDGIQFDYYLLKIDSIGNQIYQRQCGDTDKYEGLNGIYNTDNSGIML